MSTPNIPLNFINEVRDELDQRSHSFCLAKWLQVTIHLQNGQTHSCHHPRTHKIHLHELKNNPSALHNTSTKKISRKEMLDGTRPDECEYCWKIEDAHPGNISDRSIKSSQVWAHPRMDEIKSLPWAANVNPAYVEISFGNECNFRCAYCAPHISSAIMKEVKEFGPYSAQQGFSPDSLKRMGQFPLSKDEENPYVDAFWKWWPQLTKDLKVFRITGGEPLLNRNTFKFLELLRNDPMPELTLAINSNLGIPKVSFDKFLEEVKFITKNKLIKEFQLFTSVDTFGRNAEFVRFGLNYDELINNMKTYLQEVPGCELIIMCTYNAFSPVNFHKLLQQITELKKDFLDEQGNTRVTLDIPYLKDPNFLSCYVLTQDFKEFMKKDIDYLKRHAKSENGNEIYYQTEISKLERIHHWMESLEESEHRDNTRRELASYIREYCQRKNISRNDYIPEYEPFIQFCESLESKSKDF